MKKVLLGCACFLLFSLALISQNEIKFLTKEKSVYKPLDLITLSNEGTLIVKDGNNSEYISAKVNGEFSFYVSGKTGFQQIVLKNKKGIEIATKGFIVEAETNIVDADSSWNDLFKMLRWGIYKPLEFKVVRYQGKPYFLFSDWIRDHTNILKGKKYFFEDVVDAVDLFAENQLDNGMIFDFYSPADESFWINRFDNKDFIDFRPEELHVFQRVPCENDVEFWFVQAIYASWKATGDDQWLAKRIVNADKALTYNLTSPHCWSEKYNLIKRPFTIDTWDFMPADDAAFVGGDIMENIPGKSKYGIMHGDNTGFAYSCQLLSEMYAYVGNEQKAKYWKDKGNEILETLEKVSWNGEFYTHFVDEDETYKRDLGVETETQVSLSNTFALNRSISDDKIDAIIKTYQGIKEDMPESSPGEYYAIYPPFTKGFHFQTWHYVNGGVFPFIAGELAKGALNSGYESYGVEILQNIQGLMQDHNGEFPYYYIGKIPERPETKFSKVDISSLVNTSFSGKENKNAIPWTGEGEENDLSIIPSGELMFDGIPFEVLDESKNGSCIGLSSGDGYVEEVELEVGEKAQSLYVLHTLAGGGMAGWVNINYTDGSQERVYVNAGSEVKNWWNPKDVPYNRTSGWKTKVAWQGENGRAKVGVYAWGLNNPHPDKEIKSIGFTHSKLGNKWFVLGITLSNQPMYFTWPKQHGEWLVNWSAGCMMNALTDGLAGVNDIGVSFSEAKIAPKWAAANTTDVDVCICYPASGNYISYSYAFADDNTLNLQVAGVANKVQVELLLPEGKFPDSLKVDNQAKEFTVLEVKDSKYVQFTLTGLASKNIELVLK